MQRVVVVGASVAGVSAVQSLRDAGFAGEVLLVGDEDTLPYDRPPLSKAALAGGDEHLAVLRPAQWYRDVEVSLVLGAAATGLDCGARLVGLSDGRELPYDGLVVATGCSPVQLPTAAAAVPVLRTADDCAALRAVLGPGRRLTVVGAGFIGLEVAATARSMGTEVTVLERADVPLSPAVGEYAGAWLAALHTRAGVDVVCSTGVTAVDGVAGGHRVRLDDGRTHVADAVIAGIGVRPNTAWLEGSAVQLDDGVLCDAYCRSSAPGVVAAGDVARWHNPLFGEHMRVEHWTNAVEQGRAAALSLLGLAEGPFAPVPYFWSDQLSARIRMVGRAQGADQVHVLDPGDGVSLVVLYGRDGVLRGTLTVNDVRALARCRAMVAACVPWRCAVDAV